MSNPQHASLAAACRQDSWARLAPRLLALHIDPSAGPQRLVQLLEEADARVRVDASHVLRAMSRHAWRVQALAGPYRGSPRLGFQVAAGRQTWWLQFEQMPRLRIVRIERLPDSTAV
ncbi:hypothetical protein [Pseudorhodoferax sp.]|uniref:hypothetical protein n=1 Tax=Pseudorhodoferax sp. TaxID=1993553 RepID=UPI0039E5AEB8